MYKRLNDESLSDKNLPDGNRTETTELSSGPISGSYYGSRSLQDESIPRFYIPWCGVVFYVMTFLGYFFSYLQREGLNVAIVAMVNHTSVTDEDVGMSNVTADQCPRDPELQYEDGEFQWNRNQQGIVLAAYYYGYGCTQIYTSGIFHPRIWPQVSST